MWANLILIRTKHKTNLPSFSLECQNNFVSDDLSIDTNGVDPDSLNPDPAFQRIRIKGFDGGYGYRSTGHNINGPNINELQINCSIDQRKPVDV